MTVQTWPLRAKQLKLKTYLLLHGSVCEGPRISDREGLLVHIRFICLPFSITADLCMVNSFSCKLVTAMSSLAPFLGRKCSEI